MDHQSPEIDKLVAAIIAAQLTLEPAKRDATNPFFNSTYADLPAVWESLGPFRANGIAITQSPMDSPDGYIVLDTQLTHTSGQWMRSRLKMRVAKDDPQGAGSALTYARRYSLGCMTGLVTDEDDDGNHASRTTSQPTTQNFAKKFPEQAQKIKDALAQTPRPPASLAPTGSWVVPFGKHKGMLVGNLLDDDVEYLLKYCVDLLQDPRNATSPLRDKWDVAAMELRAELLARDTVQVQPENSPHNSPAPSVADIIADIKSAPDSLSKSHIFNEAMEHPYSETEKKMLIAAMKGVSK